MNAEQLELAARLIRLGVPAPVALAAALDPQAAQRGAVDGVQAFAQGLNFVVDAPGRALKTAKKVKRNPSAYSRRFGKEYKRLKAKHPRTLHKTLMKRAHAAARKAGGKKR